MVGWLPAALLDAQVHSLTKMNAACTPLRPAGLAHLHPTIMHRDIKPGNILLDTNGRAKIGDFGTSRMKVRTGNIKCIMLEGRRHAKTRRLSFGFK